MRLLNTKDLIFQEFFDNEIPAYAILSHRWSSDEVSHREFLEGNKLQSAGYAKIISFCQLALEKGYFWGWVDTCCIDKLSSAELTEAINSMFRWYRKASVCIVHLADVVLIEPKSATCWPSLTKSDWFDRGWTLQELLAPYDVEFYDAGWKFISGKRDLIPEISSKTGIEERYMRYGLEHTLACVATKMSWAAYRQTSRIEDRAYCLLGLFGINMPLLYGEGNRAFTRLQEEIIRKYDDESIFVYQPPIREVDSLDVPGNQEGPESSNVGALCMNPEGYIEKVVSKEYLDGSKEHLAAERSPYTVTHKGIQMDINYIEQDDGFWIVPLNCYLESTGEPYCMVLKPLGPHIPKSKVRVPVTQEWVYLRIGKDIAYRLKVRELRTKNRSCFVLLEDRVNG